MLVELVVSVAFGVRYWVGCQCGPSSWFISAPLLGLLSVLLELRPWSSVLRGLELHVLPEGFAV